MYVLLILVINSWLSYVLLKNKMATAITKKKKKKIVSALNTDTHDLLYQQSYLTIFCSIFSHAYQATILMSRI